ncbi:MAG: ATP synthase F1 subunit epsilon [Deltaproteobacteria bacterium]|nr:ATP synthase F1 subunit epsilon [Deltaproteobacteria bacterium]
MPLHVRIVTPRKVAFDGETSEIRAPAFLGQFGALPAHERFLAAVRPGRVILTTPEGDRRFVVGSGFVEVGSDQVTLLADLCEEVGAVTPEAASAALREAEGELVSLQDGTVAWAEAERRADLARARMG